MNQKISHRGPDGWGIGLFSRTSQFISKGRKGLEILPADSDDSKIEVLLGHRRLSILDLSDDGFNPISNECKRIWIIFNGEIYNYIELRKQLVSAGHVFTTSTDTEVIVHAWEEWGIDCFNRFNGMWAFALHDMEKGTLVLCRDRFGQKPLYYHSSNRQLIFSSEIKSILCHPSVKRSINNQTVYDFLASGYGFTDISSETFFKDIYQIPPGSYMIVDRTGIRLNQYWKLRHTENHSAWNRPEMLRELLLDSIRLRLRSDVPVGVSLSGGLDSSSILSGVKLILGPHKMKDIHSFSSWYPDRGSDERKYIHTMLDCCKPAAHLISPEGIGLAEEMESIVYHQDEPYAGTSIYASWNIMKQARAQNVPVILVGQGADELLAGYDKFYGPFFATLVQHGQLIRFVEEMISASLMKRSPLNHSLLQTFFNLCAHYLPAELKRRFRASSSLPDYINPDWGKGMQPRSIHHKHSNDILNNILYMSTIHSPLPSLLHIDDRNSMAFGIETRSPFLDYRIAEFLFSVPGHFKIQKGFSKFILRKAFSKLLPKTITWRKDKLGYPTPLARWLRKDLKNWSTDLVHSASFRTRPYWNPEHISRILKKHLEGTVDLSPTIWSFINLELWIRKFFDEKV